MIATVALTPLSFLRRSADIWPDAVAVTDESGRPISYRELRTDADRLADALRSLGVRPGDHVAVLARNTAVLLTAHFGVPGARAALVALNTRLGPTEYGFILRHCAAKAVIVEAAMASALSDPGVLPEDVAVVVVGLDAAVQLPAPVDYAGWIGSIPPGPGMLDPVDEHDPITVNYTSGTTGRPKGVVYTHRGAYLNSLSTAMGLGLDRDSRYLWTLPMFHCNGWCCTWAVTAVGGRHICLTRPDPVLILAAITEHRVTHLCAAPVVLNGLVNHPAAAGAAFDSPVRVATGGAPPAPATIARIRAMGMELTHLYGLTETYGPCLICEPQPSWPGLDDVALAAAIARQGVRTLSVDGVRVVDAQLANVPADGSTVGEIAIRSATVMAGYLHDDAATQAAFRDGWFLTGDLATVDEDGYLRIHDRAKDIIISGGENISSVEVENVLLALPGVLEAAVVARPDARWGEVPVAFVTVREGSGLTEGDLLAHVRSRIAHFKTPRQVLFTELPKTSTGKIQKTVLRGRVREQE